MRQRLQNALTQLRAIADQTSKVLERISSASERLSAKNSSTLFGCLGGFGGFTSAYILSLLWTASFPVVGVPLTAIGIVAGVLLHRGPRRFALERRIEENRLAADEILSRISNLPKSAPKEVRDELWLTYRSITGGFQAQALEAPRGSVRSSPQLLLTPAPVEAELVTTDDEPAKRAIPVERNDV